MSEGQKARYASGAVHPNRGKHLSQSTREKISKANTGKQLGEENPFYGKHHDQETLELLSRQRIEWHENNPGALTGENNPMYGNEEAGKKISEAAKARWQNPEWREQQLAIRETCKEKLSASAKLSWGDPENHERRMRSFLEKFPMTETEQNLDCLLKMHNLPFEYVGNGKLIVNFLCPDFAHHDKPLLIEISKAKYRSGRHLPSWRAEKYAAFGYKVLFLMGEDITGNNWEDICLAKIRDFIAAVNS